MRIGGEYGIIIIVIGHTQQFDGNGSENTKWKIYKTHFDRLYKDKITTYNEKDEPGENKK